MIQLHQFAQVQGMNPSPFCSKVETYCQLANISYKSKLSLPFKGAKGKLPFIVDTKNGKQRVADSSAIVAYLKEQEYGNPLDQDLSPSQQAEGHLLQRLCEESLYFAIVYSRWQDPDVWPQLRKAFFGDLPPGARSLVPVLVRRGILNALKGQGYGRHSKREVAAIAAADMSAIAASLTGHDFAVGDVITSYDAVLYAFLNSAARFPINNVVKAEAGKLPAIQEYLERMDEVLVR